MKIYVCSRGESQDYCWLSITEEGQQWEEPRLIDKVRDLIQSEVPSVVLGRFNGQLLLLVTGEESSRTDFRTRQIRNSVAWVGENSDESELRMLAVRALRGDLRAELDRAVTFGGEEGFQVSLVSLRDIEQLALTDKLANSPPDRTRKIGRTSQELRDKLAEELETHSLPSSEGPLVVVTGIKKAEDLKNAGVWRGLSSLVEAEDWETITETKPDLAQNILKNLELILYLLIAGGTLLVLWYLLQQFFRLIPYLLIASGTLLVLWYLLQQFFRQKR